ncbi:MAG: hypothetical protein QME47_06760 [Candidatus Thermoplasmatota archaeon]|nr:hypothetical protein [Candidatus Thermoplasmatota archaeon]
MVTTIQIEETTLQMLKQLKERSKAKSYEEVIKELVEAKISVPKSMFGKRPKMKKFTLKEEAEFHEL